MSVITINRSKRKCDQCGKTIPKGRKHATVSTKESSEYSTKHYHVHCDPTK